MADSSLVTCRLASVPCSVGPFRADISPPTSIQYVALGGSIEGSTPSSDPHSPSSTPNIDQIWSGERHLSRIFSHSDSGDRFRVLGLVLFFGFSDFIRVGTNWFRFEAALQNGGLLQDTFEERRSCRTVQTA